MKFTDRFFEFPIKIYDGNSIRKMINKKENLGLEEEVEEFDWVRGRAKIPYWALDKIYYYDCFSEGRTPKDVAEEGFDMTTVIHESLGEFECMWKKEVFEKKLNEFTALYERENEEEIRRFGVKEIEE